MSVYKEALIAVQKLNKMQKQIFDDAADFGIPVKSETDPAFQIIRNLKEQYFDKETDTETFVAFGQNNECKTKTLKMTMCDEWNTRKEFQITIDYTRQSFKRTLHGPIIGIISIDPGLWN